MEEIVQLTGTKIILWVQPACSLLGLPDTMLSNNINSWYIITYSKIKKPPSLVQQDKGKKRNLNGQ